MPIGIQKGRSPLCRFRRRELAGRWPTRSARSTPATANRRRRRRVSAATRALPRRGAAHDGAGGDASATTGRPRDPDAGMAIEILPGDERLIALGSSGFGVMAIVVGAERGSSSPASRAAERLLKIVRFLARADRFHGAWPHFLDGRTGRRSALLREVRRRRRPGRDGVPRPGPAGRAAVFRPRTARRAGDPRTVTRSLAGGRVELVSQDPGRRGARTGTGRRTTASTSAIR